MEQKRGSTESIFTAVDLFCGCGGTTQGLRDAGFLVLGAVDIEKLAVETYLANHPGVRTWTSDIKKLKTTQISRALHIRKGELDLLAGCPPCQGFSTMRTLNGKVAIDDPRNNLLLEFFRFVKELLPKAIMLENVPGLATDNLFLNFCTAIGGLGYIGEARIMNAADYGVPQRRRRLIYIAGYQRKIDFALPIAKRKTVREAFTSLLPAGKSGDPLHDIKEHRSERIRELIASIPLNGGSRTDLPDDKQLECHKKCSGFKDVYGRMTWEAVAPTITSGCFNPSKGRFLHPEENRTITLREAALLQGFPHDYLFPNVNSRTAIALLIGNALPPPFITAHAMVIKAALLGGNDFTLRA